MRRAVAVLALAAAVLAVGAPAHAQDPGPYTCVSGKVWREAYQTVTLRGSYIPPGDKICVTAVARKWAADENAEAGLHRQPGGGAYGPDTCRQGYVWREARPSDHVCVLPEKRRRVQRENQEAALGYANPLALPRSGVGWKPSNYQRTCVWGTGFTRGGQVALYAWDPRLRDTFGPLRVWNAGNGAIGCWEYSGDNCRPREDLPDISLLLVDVATGLVRYAGDVTRTNCELFG
jgi:hypothetical protein